MSASRFALIAAISLTSFGGAQAGSIGGAVLPNADIRALEPPIDVTEEQLAAQHHGRSVVVEPPPSLRHHRRHTDRR